MAKLWMFMMMHLFYDKGQESFSDTTTTYRILSVRCIFLVLKIGHAGKIGQKYAYGLEMWCYRRINLIAPIVLKVKYCIESRKKKYPTYKKT
jgi:hypothetical protein